MPYIGNQAGNRFVASKAASVYSGNGSTTAFTLEHAVGSDEDILVSVDGVIQEPSVAYAVSSGTTLTFTAAPSSNAGNNIFVYYLFRTVGTIDHPATSALSATSGTLSSSLAMTSNDPTITMTDSSGTNDIVTLQSTSGALIVTARDGNANGEIIFKGDTGSAVTEHMRINNAGIITKPKQPAFLARGTTQNNMAVGSDVTIVLSTEVFDQNADYDNGTYTFTAPITGRYQLNMNLYLTNVDTAANFCYGAIKTSNQFYYNLFDLGGLSADPVYWSVTMSVLADMDANDTAKVVFYQANGTQQTDSTTHSHFSGFLAC